MIEFLRTGGGGAAAGGAWNPIAETILGAPAATVTFAAIPGTYRNLGLFIYARTDNAAISDSIEMRCNADAGNNYAWSSERFTTGGDAHAGAVLGAVASAQIARADAATGRANSFGGTLVYFWRYASTTTLKQMRSDGGGMHNWAAQVGGQHLAGWDSTAAITSITLLPTAGANFVAGSIFTLYGIT